MAKQPSPNPKPSPQAGQVWLNSSDCWVLYWGPAGRYLLRTLLTRKDSHVSFFRAGYQTAPKRFCNSRDAYIEAPEVVKLLRGQAPWNVIIDALLELPEEHYPRWVRKHLERVAREGIAPDTPLWTNDPRPGPQFRG